MSEQHPGKAALNAMLEHAESRRTSNGIIGTRHQANVVAVASYVSDLEARLEKAEAERDGWEPIETAPDGLHIRGLWVRVKRAGLSDFWYWDCYAGFIDDETGEWKTLSDDDCGWSAGDFTHWAYLPSPPTPPQGDEA
jgi:hypothetical protein